MAAKSEVDDILDALGGRGKYQMIQFWVVSWASISASFQLLSIVFVGRSIPHTCEAPANISDVFDHTDGQFDLNNSKVSYGKCAISVDANISGQLHSAMVDCIYGYRYTEKKHLSFISDMDIVCKKAPLRGLGQTFLILGQALGALSLPIFSDRYGRRPVHLVSHFGVLVVGMTIALVPNYTMYLVLRVLLGALQQGVVLTNQTISIEIFPTRYRRFISLMGGLHWTACTVLIAPIAYFMRDQSWRYLQVTYCSVSLYVIFQFFFLDESLRWLAAKNKPEQLKKTLEKAARISGKDVDKVMEIYNNMMDRKAVEMKLSDSDEDADKEDEIDKKTDTGPFKSFLAILKTRRLAINVAVLWFTWFTASMTYFGLYMTTHTLAGSRFINFFLYAILESPSTLMIFFVVDRIGRKKTAMILFCIAITGLLGATIIKAAGDASRTYEIASTVFSCIGMLGISGAFGICFLFTPELFPTNIRNIGLGTSSAFSRMGGMLAPFSSVLADHVQWAPAAIFSGCCAAVLLLLNILPETMGRPLPQTVDDVKAWYEKKNSEDVTVVAAKTENSKL